MDRVLVGYATRNGSTAEVARIIAASLHDAGAQATVVDLKADPDPIGYDLVVAGSAIHGGTWLPEGLNWLAAHPVMPRVTLFNVSMSGADPAKRETALGYNKAAAALVTADAQAAFGGRYTPERVGGFWRTLLRMAGKKPVDAIDPALIHAWVVELLSPPPGTNR